MCFPYFITSQHKKQGFLLFSHLCDILLKNTERSNCMLTFLTGVTLTIHLIVDLALYLCIAFSLWNIARTNHLSFAWIAFVPFLQYAIIGTLCEEYILWGVRIRPLSLILVGLNFLQFFLSLISGFFLLNILLNHKFFYLFHPERAMFYAALSMLGEIPLAIFLFLLRDKPIQMSAAAYPYPFPNRK